MKIKDLIKKLEIFPEDMEVAIADSYGDVSEPKEPVVRLFKKESDNFELLYEAEKEKAEGKVVVLW
jgi:hypothetical protein